MRMPQEARQSKIRRLFIFLFPIGAMGQDSGNEILAAMAFSILNKLPKEPIRSRFCNHDQGTEQAYVDMLDSSNQSCRRFDWLLMFLPLTAVLYSLYSHSSHTRNLLRVKHRIDMPNL